MLMTSATTTKRYDLKTIREEVSNLVEVGVISLDQPLRILYDYMPAQHWYIIECELERYDFLLRDRIIDLIGKLDWSSD